MEKILLFWSIGFSLYIIIDEIKALIIKKRVPIYTILFVIIIILGDEIREGIYTMKECTKIFYLFTPSSNILEYIDGCDTAIKVIKIKKIQDIIQKKKRDKQDIYFFNQSLGFKKEIKNLKEYKYIYKET